MASIKKLDNGTYQATIYVGKDENGKRINKYVTKPGLKECKKAAREIEQQIEDNKLTNNENIRVTVWIEKWLKINKNKYSPSTYSLYQSYLKNHYKPFFKQIKFKDLREIHVKKFANTLLEKQSSTSARRILSCLKPIFYDALKDKSPMRDIKLPKEAEVDYSDVPTPGGFKIIHDAVKGTRDEPIILLAAWCGFRREEIFALRENDLNFKESTIKIDEVYVINENNKYEIRTATKSENGKRTVSAPSYLMDLLKKIIQNTDKVTNIRRSKTKFLFDILPSSYSSYLAKQYKLNRYPKIRLHFLRHYHATWLLHQDVPDLYAAERLGHDPKMLKEKYQHMWDDRKEKINQDIIDKMQKETV